MLNAGFPCIVSQNGKCYANEPLKATRHSGCSLSRRSLSLTSLHCQTKLPGRMQLRQRGHDFIILNIKYEFNKHHFTARSGYV